MTKKTSLWTLVVILLLLVAILACGGTESIDKQVTASTATPSVQREPSPSSPSSDVVSGDVTESRPVANTGANLRAGPGTEYDRIGGIPAERSLDLVGVTEAGDWFQLDSGAWIAAFLVDNAPDDLPIIDANTLQAQTVDEVPLSGDTPAPATQEKNMAQSLIGVGTHIVGDTVQPGIYRGVAGEDLWSSCYWQRMSNLSGESDAIIANDNAVGQFYVEVRPTDFALKTDCRLTPLAQVPSPSIGKTLPLGTYLVGRDIKPGTYKGQAGEEFSEWCYWGRLKNVSGDMESIIANDNAKGSFFVQIQASDFALKTACVLELVDN